MQPEISHRCPACGVSIRDQGESVLFCPECGKPLAPAEAEANSNPQPDAANDHGSQAPARVADEPASKNPDRPRVGARERTRDTLHRASDAARGAIGDNVKRVEKIHKVSTVMLEEATYDPSLRFVLVALGLFVLFIILLVLSKVME